MRQNINTREILDEVYQEFADGITAINFQKSISLIGFQRQHSELTRQLAESSGARVRSFSTRMYLVDLSKGNDLIDPSSGNIPMGVFGGNEEAYNDELVEWLESGANKELRWNLVSIFELHETFVKDLYAAIGFLDPGLWRQKDLGNESIVDVEAKDLDWYEAQVRAVHRNDCKQILTQLRKNIQGVEKYEKTWWMNPFTDHKFWRAVIEYFRHLIVHSGGEAEVEHFWKRIAEQTGCSLTGNEESIEQRKVAVGRFIKPNAGTLAVHLIDLSQPNYLGVDGKFKKLLEIVVNHSCLLYSCVARHFGEDPAWRR